MWVVVTDLKVLCTEVINGLHLSKDLEFGKGADFPLELQIYTRLLN